MTGYKIKFNGIDRLYDEYSWRLTRRAKQVWSSGNVLQGQYLDKFERELGKKYIMHLVELNMPNLIKINSISYYKCIQFILN